MQLETFWLGNQFLAQNDVRRAICVFWVLLEQQKGQDLLIPEKVEGKFAIYVVASSSRAWKSARKLEPCILRNQLLSKDEEKLSTWCLERSS